MRKLLFFTFFLISTAWNYSAGKRDNALPEETQILVSAGTFTMGSDENETGRGDGESPQRKVSLPSFFMGKHEVTQMEYKELMGKNDSNFKGDNLPAENVSWFEAVEYCNRRSKKEKLTPAYKITGKENNYTVTWNRKANGYRLPTEAEWEYACRAGTSDPFNTGKSITTDQANYNGYFPYNKNDNNKAKVRFQEKTTPVGSFAPNPWGLYDMHGNVFEWCWDWYGTYTGSAVINPAGAPAGTYRIIRGGSWAGTASGMRSAFRANNIPSAQNSYLGFRIARNAK